MTTAAVVGSGPNGLAAAIRLAKAGVAVTVYEASERIGGGALTSQLTVDSLLHDDCSVAMPMGVASPFFRSLDLARHGLVWRHAPIEMTHPLIGAAPGVLHRDAKATAANLGADGKTWLRLFNWLSEHSQQLANTALSPVVSLPRHPLVMARMGLESVVPAAAIAKLFRTQQGAALFGGIAAHAILPLTNVLSSGTGIVLGSLAHADGWPVPEGGSGSLTQALAMELRSLGGRIETATRVTSVRELGTDLTILTVPPAIAMRLIDAVPPRVLRAWRRFKHGPGAYKIDLAIEGEAPWTDEESKRTSVLHLGGTFAEIQHAEREVSRGRMPERPFILAAQPHVADPTRRVGSLTPLWMYAHVPNAWHGNETERILNRVEQFAPGLRERIVGMNVRNPAALEAHNAAYIGGDISGGAATLNQLIARPRIGALGYRTGVSGVYLGGASTSPGPGVHGMSGVHAAETALRDRKML